MAKFVEVEHKDIESIALVPETSLAHYAKAGWTPVTEEQPTEEWKREDIDAFAARLGVDTTGERSKAAALAAIDLAQQQDNHETPGTGADDNKES